jgi:predicted nucleic acid-binding protein
MQWVFDASITMAWCFEDERTAQTDALLDQLVTNLPAIVPQIWPLEIANVLVHATRKGRISQAKRRQFLTLLSGAPITVDLRPAPEIFDHVLLLADKHRLTAYDASYLELSMRLGVPLATSDDDLRRAALSVGLRMMS